MNPEQLPQNDDLNDQYPTKENHEKPDDSEFAFESTEEILAKVTETIYGSLEDIKYPEEYERNEDNDHGYEYFYPDERELLYRGFKNAGEFIRENNIANVVFVDRSARGGYIGIKEYLKVKYPDESQPQFYFVNPRGFSMVYFNQSPAALKIRLFPSSEEIYQRIDKRFAEVYTSLAADKDRPVLIFDACVHRGVTMLPVITSFERQGFKDIKTGVYSKTHPITPFPIDFEMVEDDGHCSPFMIDGILRRNADVTSIVDSHTKESDYVRIAEIRGELSRLVRDGIEEEDKKK